MRPLSIREAPPGREVRGVLPPALNVIRAGLSQSAALFQLRIRINLPSIPLPFLPTPFLRFPSPPLPSPGREMALKRAQ